MKTVYITRRETFNAAHKLWRPEWSDEKNQEVFGKCSNHNWHGHNFQLYITVKGVPHPETGFVMNLKVLSVLIREHIIEALDHKNLNLDVPFLTGIMASTENMAIAIWDILDPLVQQHGGEMAKIKLIETENNFVEYYGGKEPF
ncbi:MAG: 6-carboxytetrahydropterin synthase [Crocinitomicaceae bacterium]|jgi:6-pyruvoyltetrahydropterin/6-carboxytetrahydropterin synthase|nr:6-carboxytetrahydropterin synthase [Crocinitomicaceae bacterium]MBP6032489.1 6-carboxytetrahydropterin synthase [Crocinitomicaceae bacterium]